jgi:type IV pilus assembly protein PilF
MFRALGLRFSARTPRAAARHVSHPRLAYRSPVTSTRPNAVGVLSGAASAARATVVKGSGAAKSPRSRRKAITRGGAGKGADIRIRIPSSQFLVFLAQSDASWHGVDMLRKRARSATLLLALAACGGAGPEEAKIASAEYGLANDAFQRGRYREALSHVERALEHDDHNAEAAYLGAMIMLVFCSQDETSPDCRYDEAERFCRITIEADPEMRDAKNALAVVLVHRGRPLEAIDVLKPLAHDILYRSPEKAWGNLGWAYLEAGRTADAIGALERAVASQPLFCVGHYRLGLAYEKRGEFAAARQALTRAVSIEEGDCRRLQDAFWARARVEERLGAETAMRDDLERCKELAPTTNVGKRCTRRLSAAN